MLSGSEKYYDEIYSSMGKDYAAEADRIHELIQKYKQSNGNTLLDVACGTGTHMGLLCDRYDVTGVDINIDMLRVARKKLPGLRFLQGDMRTLHLNHQFDAVTCLFSAIGYMRTKADLQKAVKSMSRHILLGGVVLVEPWFTPEQWNVGRVSTIYVDKPHIKIVRMSHSAKKGKISLLEFEYLIGTARGIEHMAEHHEFGLFTHDEYIHAFTRAGLTVTHHAEGVDGRGLYIGLRDPNP
ncbi:MAG TPA: class I SAM-dependent methyltransferase [Anaerolineales bacterium]|nr:class I SAM-dependent methyltransferase [Anaerolineales bacterium]